MLGLACLPRAAAGMISEEVDQSDGKGNQLVDIPFGISETSLS